jgi:hypothetical protein
MDGPGTEMQRQEEVTSLAVQQEAMKRQMAKWVLANMKRSSEEITDLFLSTDVVIAVVPHEGSFTFLPVKGVEKMLELALAATSDSFDQKIDLENGAVLINKHVRATTTAIACGAFEMAQRLMRIADEQAANEGTAAQGNVAMASFSRGASGSKGASAISRANGWQRLGIVLSVLWAVAGPLWLVIDTNTRADESYQSCVSLAYSLSLSSTDQEKAVERCGSARLASTTSLPQMWEEKDGRNALALMVGGPIVAMWLLGGIVISTIRWIAHGFGLGR